MLHKEVQVRSGVKHVRLVDFDMVSLSSLNRHAVATLEDVGKSKVPESLKHTSANKTHVHIISK
jgi:tRNA A37 threonylcarbamoyladenosine dehydratase